jgi:hypothetical protein
MNRNSAFTKAAREYAAMYGRTQIENIVSTVVPTQELFDAQKSLALASLAQQTSHDSGGVSSASLASELPE